MHRLATAVFVIFTTASAFAQYADKPKFVGGPKPRVPNAQAHQKTTLVGTRLAAFSTHSIDTNPLVSASLKGKPALFILCTTASSACRAELPDVERGIRRTYGDKVNIVMIAPGEDDAMLRAFNSRLALTYRIVADPDEKLSALFPGSGLPRTYVVDSNGMIVHQEIGYTPRQFTAIHKAVRVALKLEAASVKSELKIQN